MPRSSGYASRQQRSKRWISLRPASPSIMGVPSTDNKMSSKNAGHEHDGHHNYQTERAQSEFFLHGCMDHMALSFIVAFTSSARVSERASCVRCAANTLFPEPCAGVFTTGIGLSVTIFTGIGPPAPPPMLS